MDVEHPRRSFDGVAVFALDQSPVREGCPATRKQFMKLTAAIHAALRKRDGVTVVGGVPPRAGAWSNRATEALAGSAHSTVTPHGAGRIRAPLLTSRRFGPHLGFDRYAIALRLADRIMVADLPGVCGRCKSNPDDSQ